MCEVLNHVTCTPFFLISQLNLEIFLYLLPASPCGNKMKTSQHLQFSRAGFIQFLKYLYMHITWVLNSPEHSTIWKKKSHAKTIWLLMQCQVWAFEVLHTRANYFKRGQYRTIGLLTSLFSPSVVLVIWFFSQCDVLIQDN